MKLKLTWATETIQYKEPEKIFELSQILKLNN